MREAVETTLGGKRYSIAPLPAMRALRLWPLVAKGFMVDGVAMERLTADEVEKLTKEMLSMARVEGKELLPTIDVDMAGDIPTLMQLLSFAVNVNYSSFSSGSVGPGQPTGSDSGA